MTNQQGAPEALRLADALDGNATTNWTREEAAAELRRLHFENGRLAALVEAQQPAPSAAADWKLVPEGPTPDMVRAGWALLPSATGDRWDAGAVLARSIYSAMLAAAPQPSPTPQADSQPAPSPAYPPLPDFDTAEQHIYGACRRYITEDMLYPIHNLIRDAIDADRAARAPADSVTATAGGVAEPMEPTQEMIAAVLRLVDLEQADPEDHRYDDGSKLATQICRAVLAAATHALRIESRATEKAEHDARHRLAMVMAGGGA